LNYRHKNLAHIQAGITVLQMKHIRAIGFVKFPTSPLSLAAAALLTLAGTAHAQYLDAGITWGSTTAMIGVPDIITTGTSYVDALQLNPNVSSDVTVGDTIFHTFSDVTDIAIQVPGGWLGNPSSFPTAAPSSAAYSAAVSNFGFNNGNEGVEFKLSNLTVGATYQVEAWLTADFLTEFTGTNVGTLTNSSYVVGTFTADATTASFSTITNVNAFTVISDVSLREVTVPEPSTYAMMLGGLALLGFCVRRRAVLLS